MAHAAERLKKALMIWLAVYPTALVVLSVAGDALRAWPLPVRLLVSTAVVVAMVTTITQPLVNASVRTTSAWLGRWLSREPRP